MNIALVHYILLVHKEYMIIISLAQIAQFLLIKDTMHSIRIQYGESTVGINIFLSAILSRDDDGALSMHITGTLHYHYFGF